MLTSADAARSASRRRFAFALAVAAVAVVVGGAHAGDAPSLEGVARAEALDPATPIVSSVPATTTGALVRRGPLRPASSPSANVTWSTACSFRHPMCVHTARTGLDPAATAVLLAAERAWELATGPLALPAPAPDPATGAYDIYLVDPPVPSGAPSSLVTETVLSERDPRAAFDRTSAFTLVDRRAVVLGCALDATIARELTRAILLGVAPATDEPVARAQTSYLAKLMVPCAMGDADGVDVFQAHPDRALMDPWPDHEPTVGRAFASGAALFWWWLDDAFGATPGTIVRATWALSPTSTPLGAVRWASEPDAFDVLRITFKGALTTGSTLDDLLLDFAIARALVGRASDEHHALETATLGDVAAPRLDWDVEWPTQPRRLAARAPLAPTGSAYLRVRRGGAPKGTSLRVETTWEEHAKMRWAVVKLDARGHEQARVVIPVANEKSTDAQITIVDLDDTAAVLIVGVNAGDPSFQLDPDDVVWEPHGFVVSIASAL